MLSLTGINPSTANEPKVSAISMNDPEAFFLFLANSIDEHGELITPIDIEEYELDTEQTIESESEQMEALQ